jgi:hypothetical protein
MAHSRPMKRPADSIYIRVRDDGSMICADMLSQAVMRRKKIRRGEVIRIKVLKLHDYSQFKKAHKLAWLLIDGVDEFERFGREDGTRDAHGALKHLQRISGVECDDQTLEIPGAGAIVIRTPRSLAYEEMPQDVFDAAYAGFCDYIKKTWWKNLDQADIEQMASLLGEGS